MHDIQRPNNLEMIPRFSIQLCTVLLYLATTFAHGNSSLSVVTFSMVKMQGIPRTINLEYRSIESTKTSEDLLRTIVKNQSKLDDLTVKWSGLGIPTNWTLLSEAIRTTKELGALQWKNDYLIPDVVLSALENQKPHCKMYYTIPFRDRDDDRDHIDFIRRAPLPERRNILGHPNLYALKAAIKYRGKRKDHDMALAQQIMKTCPNLRELDLGVSQGGCMVAWNQPYAFDFTKSKNNFPPLTSLIFDGYHQGVKVEGGRWMEWEASNPMKGILQWP